MASRHRKRISELAAILLLISHILAEHSALGSPAGEPDPKWQDEGDFSAGAAAAEAAASVERSVIETERAPLNVVSANQRQRHRHQQQQHRHWRGRHQAARDKLKNSWCQLDCAGPSAASGAAVCGSDGRWYESLCELKREACRTGAHLFKRPREVCRRALPLSGSNGAGREKVRIVELRRRCNASELQEMKWKLLDQFKGDFELMFQHFDANGDNRIEAHELWPSRGKPAAEQLRYAQLWDEHSQRCHTFKERHLEPAATGHQHDESKCWFYLELPFEPLYPPNACSLSHLMLFALPAGRYAFTPDAFRRAFAEGVGGSKATGSGESQRSGAGLRTELTLSLGESRTINCVNSLNAGHKEDSEEQEQGTGSGSPERRCLWTRFGADLAAAGDPHVWVDDQSSLVVSDAQLYLSGLYRCQCADRGGELRELALEVLAKPRVQIRPKFQWSLPGSRVSFECLYEAIDTSTLNWPAAESNATRPAATYQSPAQVASGQSAAAAGNSDDEGERRRQIGGLRVQWFAGQRGPIVDRKGLPANGSRRTNDADHGDNDDQRHDWNWPIDGADHDDDADDDAGLSARASISMASSRLILENIKLNDSGRISCAAAAARKSNSASDSATLLVQDSLPAALAAAGSAANPTNNYLWLFHDNGISIYKLSPGDGQEMELLREINGQSSIKAEVDGNWNQLTLCGGLNSEQAVICEWSDNALLIDLNNYAHEPQSNGSSQVSSGTGNRRTKYVYVGQPNLNRVLIMDAEVFEIVAIINTEPQPRKLFLYKPSKMHLSKWLRRRLSPAANRRWLSAIELGRAHPLSKTPAESRLSSENQQPTSAAGQAAKPNSRSKREPVAGGAPQSVHQFDVWLLCYGQPLVLNPEGLASDEDQPIGYFAPFANSSTSGSESASQPFTPRLQQQPSSAGYWARQLKGGAAGSPFGPGNLEARLRNRKSVHIIQSSFLPLLSGADGSLHQHETTDSAAGSISDEQSMHRRRGAKNLTVVGQFQHSTVLTTHHIYTSTGSGTGNTRNRLDLIHDLIVPPKPHALELNEQHKIHFAYVTHYNQPNLFRVNMDEYKYDKEIDLDCDPINLITTAQGLLIVQCRSLITHNLVGQLILDQLTSSRIEFNDNIRAQEAYLSPDNRYLVSVYTAPGGSGVEGRAKRAANGQEKRSIVYVQLIGLGGLKLEYEINLSLELSQCSFVWKEGYYAAVFVSSNLSEEQSEILSLRLADGRLELTARVPGLISPLRHKDQLIVSSELQLAALTTNQGTYVVDLEENRLLQTLRRHQSPPTLLWI